LTLSDRKVGQKDSIINIYMISLPVGYFHAADCSLNRKRNLEPGLQLLLSAEVVIVTRADFFV
jgi:hypothetical protein